MTRGRREGRRRRQNVNFSDALEDWAPSVGRVDDGQTRGRDEVELSGAALRLLLKPSA
jgi:hypothetical protein